jgi:hypothetical protein
MSIKNLITTHKKQLILASAFAILVTISIIVFANKATNSQLKVELQILSSSSEVYAFSSLSSESQSSSVASSQSSISTSAVDSIQSQFSVSDLPATKIVPKQDPSKIITPYKDLINVEKVTTTVASTISNQSSSINVQTVVPNPQVNNSNQNTNLVIMANGQQNNSTTIYNTVTDTPSYNSNNSQQTISTGCGNNCQTVTIEPPACYYTNSCPSNSPATSVSICSVALPTVCATVEEVTTRY